MKRVVAAVIREEGRYLICRRSEGGDCACLWEFPGGKLEQGETFEQCLQRECREELGIAVKVDKLIDTASYQYPSGWVFLWFYNAKILKGTIVPKVHTEIKWVLPEELSQYTFCPADKNVVKQLAEE